MVPTQGLPDYGSVGSLPSAFLALLVAVGTHGWHIGVDIFLSRLGGGSKKPAAPEHASSWEEGDDHGPSDRGPSRGMSSS